MIDVISSYDDLFTQVKNFKGLAKQTRNHAKQGKSGAHFSSKKNRGKHIERRLATKLHDRAEQTKGSLI